MSALWRCGPRELSLERPLVMGIVNVTPDSFSDAGEHFGTEAAIEWGLRLLAEGADIIDVGGESTRPGSDEVDLAEELRRTVPVVEALSRSDAIISVDTRHAEVARACVEAGASIVNDVSGFRDEAMIAVAVQSDVGVVAMHMLGEPKTMQQEPHYTDVVAEVKGYLLDRAAALEAAGVARERIAIDPGIGFGKTLEHNLALLRATPELAATGYPVLVGASRKRFIGELTGLESPGDRVVPSVVAAVESVRLGAQIVRVHDVAATVQGLNVAMPLFGERV